MEIHMIDRVCFTIKIEGGKSLADFSEMDPVVRAPNRLGVKVTASDFICFLI